MSTILGPTYQWHIVDLPAGDPQEPENRALVQQLFLSAYKDWADAPR